MTVAILTASRGDDFLTKQEMAKEDSALLQRVLLFLTNLTVDEPFFAFFTKDLVNDFLTVLQAGLVGLCAIRY